MPARPCPDIHPLAISPLTTRAGPYVPSRRAGWLWGSIFSLLGIGVWGVGMPGGFQTPVARDLHGVVGLGWVALRCQVDLGVRGGGGFGWWGGWVLGRLVGVWGGLGIASVQLIYLHRLPPRSSAF